jgi:group 4 capsule polysaccharide lipoprotein GfcB/YjbF
MGAVFQMTRFAPLLLALTLLGACTNASDDFEQMRQIVTPGQVEFDPRFTALADAGNSVPAMQVSLVEQDRAGVILLESRRDGLDTWLTPDGATLIMQQGMLVGTRGFGAGLMASDIDQSLAMVLGGQTGMSERFLSFLNGDDKINTRTYLCDIENRGAREILIGGKPTKTRLMAEDCRSLDQTFLNLYWISVSGNRIVQSRQWAGDFTGVVTTRVVPR